MTFPRDGWALEPTLVMGDSAPELVDLALASFEEGAPDANANRYEAGELLGAGGMGEVRLCRDAHIGRKVAVKRLKHGVAGELEARARFLREARVQGQLEHPAIVPVYDVGQDGDVEYFTMKRVRGQTLAEVLAEGKTTTRKLLSAFSTVCLAVDYAHTRGVLHRDLKPANVMLGDFGEVYVLDWGLAKVTGAPDREADAIVACARAGEGATEPGYILGTPGYIAPEVLEGAEPDARADVYALGAILFEILAGEPLRPGRNADERIAATLEGAERRPSRAAPPELVELCVRATARELAARTPSARELHEAIERHLDGDRDLALRRSAAARHAELAQAAFERAGRDGGDADRRRALAEVGTAIVLDPDNTIARSTLLALLTTPPRDLPAEAQAELVRAERSGMRNDARVGVVSYGAFSLFLPCFLWMGVMSWTWLAISGSLFLVTLATFYAVMTGPTPTRANQYFIFLISSVTIGTLAAAFSPYLALPGLVAANSMAFAARPRRFPMWFVVLVCCLVIAIPLALEWTGVVDPRMLFEEGRIVILPGAIGLPPIATQVVLFVTTMATIAAAIAFSAYTHDAATAAERRLHLHLWQLRQLVPADAHAAVIVRTPSLE
jgi:eukaryotic-like serine/threonine-protein kinase